MTNVMKNLMGKIILLFYFYFIRKGGRKEDKIKKPRKLGFHLSMGIVKNSC